MKPLPRSDSTCSPHQHHSVVSVIATLSVALSLTASARAEDKPWEWQTRRMPEVGFNPDQAEVYRVTSLAGKGDGTLREALAKEGPRLVVFEVGGVIDLEKKNLHLTESQIVIAGQTAPSPGITLIKGGLRISASQVVVSHLRVRPGDAGEPKGSGWNPDGISTYGGPVDVWIDHCSVTWGIDENLSPTSYKPPNGIPGHRMFVRNCIIAEGLNDATHEEGPHSKGSLVFGGTKQVAIVRNLYCSNLERNPLFQPDTSGVVVNNVIANPGQRSIHAGGVKTDGAQRPLLSVVGNIVLFGKDTKKSSAVFEGTADAYFKDNVGFNLRGQPIPELRVPFETLPEPPLWPEGLEVLGEARTLWHIARYAGARPADRDATDTRIVRDALSGTARLINSQDDVEGYPEIEPVHRALDVPAENRVHWLNAYSAEVGVPDTRSPKPVR